MTRPRHRLLLLSGALILFAAAPMVGGGDSFAKVLLAIQKQNAGIEVDATETSRAATEEMYHPDLKVLSGFAELSPDQSSVYFEHRFFIGNAGQFLVINRVKINGQIEEQSKVWKVLGQEAMAVGGKEKVRHTAQEKWSQNLGAPNIPLGDLLFSVFQNTGLPRIDDVGFVDRERLGKTERLNVYRLINASTQQFIFVNVDDAKWDRVVTIPPKTLTVPDSSRDNVGAVRFIKEYNAKAKSIVCDIFDVFQPISLDTVNAVIDETARNAR